MPIIESSISEVKVERITFLVSSYFKEQEGETIDQKLCNLIRKSQKNMITTPIS